MKQDEPKEETIEQQAKNHFDSIGRPDDGNEMRAWVKGAESQLGKIQSLRDQLAAKEKEIAVYIQADKCAMRIHDHNQNEIKELKEALSEVIPIAEYGCKGKIVNKGIWEHAVDKARKLIQ